MTNIVLVNIHKIPFYDLEPLVSLSTIDVSKKKRTNEKTLLLQAKKGNTVKLGNKEHFDHPKIHHKHLTKVVP